MAVFVINEVLSMVAYNTTYLSHLCKGAILTTSAGGQSCITETGMYLRQVHKLLFLPVYL